MSLSGKHILVLEDEPIIGLALEDQLTVRGATVYLADRIEEAAAIVESTPIDWAILDVNVHGRPSYDVAEALAERGIPFLFATGYGDQSHPPAFAAALTVSKPYSIEEIARAIG